MTPTKQQCPGLATLGTEGKSFAGDNQSLPVGAAHRAQALGADYLERVTLRHLQEVLAQATRGHWQARADVLEAARPRPGEFHGQATREALNGRWERLTADALECRRHAELFDHHAVDADLVADVLGWGRA